MSESAAHYHALNTVLETNYRLLLQLKEERGSWEVAWHSLDADIKKNWPVEEKWQELAHAGIALVLREDPAYPAVLREIPWSPLGIYIRGAPIREGQSVAIVGTRKATSDSRNLARDFGRELGRRGVTVLSGLALGIDAAAHEGSLEGEGNSVAVFGTGIDRVYPRHNEKLAERILQSGGTIISEYPLGAPALPYRFIERNRIVSGLAQGVLIIEAPLRSGALATARFALDQNRDVFVVPGPARHPHFAGSHFLIRQGAQLVGGIRDLLEDIGLGEKSPLDIPVNEEERIIISILENAEGPLPVDKIIEQSRLKAPLVNQTLSFLIIKNAVKETGEGYQLSKGAHHR